MMPMDGKVSVRAAEIEDVLKAEFDAARREVAWSLAEAEEGDLIQQSERPIFDRINQLKQQTMAQGLQHRIDEIEASFFPSGPP